MSKPECIYQYRWYDNNRFTTTYMTWYPWTFIDENKVKEIEYYISQGLCYQLRKLEVVSQTGFEP